MGGREEQKRDPGRKPSGKLKNSRLLSQPEKVLPALEDSRLLAIWHAYVAEEDIEIPINNVPPLAVAGGRFQKKMDGEYKVVPNRR